MAARDSWTRRLSITHHESSVAIGRRVLLAPRRGAHATNGRTVRRSTQGSMHSRNVVGRAGCTTRRAKHRA
jgi:hypothetical protein